MRLRIGHLVSAGGVVYSCRLQSGGHRFAPRRALFLAHPPEEANSRLETTRYGAYNDRVAITVIYEHKWPCAGEWYAIGGAECFAAFRLDHVHVGQELQYEQ